MNDAHDNAADDRAMYRRIQTDQAVEAFRKQELKRLQLEMAEYALEKLLNGRTDTDRYFTETEQVRHQMELKRADYERLGKLPKTIGPNPPEDKEARPEDYWRDARQPQTSAAHSQEEPGHGYWEAGDF